MLTIGQLAALVGVTVKAIRHYHRRGLLPESECDHSGYRRYDAQAAITLSRIKTLTDAGVPLVRIRDLQHAPADLLQAVIDDLDHDLAARIAHLEATRRRLAALRHPDLPDAAYLPQSVAEHLRRLAALGLDHQALTIEREGWTLIAVLHPDDIDAWIEDKNALLADPDAAELYRQVHQARAWPPDDPRLVDLAERVADLIRRFPPRSRATTERPVPGLLAHYATSMPPAWHTLQDAVDAAGNQPAINTEEPQHTQNEPPHPDGVNSDRPSGASSR